MYVIIDKITLEYSVFFSKPFSAMANCSLALVLIVNMINVNLFQNNFDQKIFYIYITIFLRVYQLIGKHINYSVQKKKTKQRGIQRYN